MSQGEYILPDLAQLYTINYECNQGSIGNQLTTTSYNAYTSFNLPTPTTEGYEFVGWYTDSELTNPVELDENDKYRIKQDTTLYAKWVESNTITSWGDLQTKIELANTSTVTEFVITEDLTATSTITVSKPFKITSDKNVTITRGNTTGNTSFTDAFFKVESAGNLELEGTENITITLDGGKVSSTNDGGAVYVSGGTFTMNDGVTITKCNAKDGGAVYITNVGTFNMTGGTITGCSATNSGGGVWMNGRSSFSMSGYSKIENCTATNNEGGGVFVTDLSNPCTFKMLDDATITECSAEKGGGGVSYGCGTSGTFEISENAKIRNNTNNTNNNSFGGGGIYLYGKLTMNGGTISGNEASNGAGVYVRDSSSFTMNVGTISDNKATGYGGGVYLSDSTSSFTMNGGVIGKEIEEGTEGAKQSWEDAATEDKHSNSANGGGGGIYAVDGTVTIKDAKVSYNYVPDDDKKGNPDGTSLSSGGGICMEKGTLTLENTEVSYNRGYLGGGVRCYNDGTVNVGTLTLKNATIKGNAGKHYAWSNFGGALAIRNFDVICDKSAEASIIEENYSADGGAVFLEYTTSTLENIIIRNNSFNDNGYKYGSEMLLWENANISIASNTVNISSDNTTERKGIFINRSTDKLNLSGGISLNSPINLHFESGQSSPSTVTVAGNLSENNVATIYLVGNYTEGTQVLVAEDEVNLADQVGKFTLKNENYKISDDGRVAQNSGGGGTVTGITYAGTDSTSSLPKFYITTAEGLATFRNIVNGTLLDDTLTSYTISADSSVPGIADYSITNQEAFTKISGVLKDDIDLSGIEWIPIGTEDSPFEGSFDGQNKTISNLTISNATTENQGLFGVFNCSLSDEKMCLSNICVTGSITTSSPYAGGLVGQATNIVFQNCENSIEINSSSETVGGLVGKADTCDFIGCTNYADIISTSSSSCNLCVGGIAGLITDVTAEYCYNAGNISANMSVGGIFGFEQSSSISYPTIEYCVNTGVITGSSYYGGIVGYASKALSLGYCANYGEITYSGNEYNPENGFILGGCSSSSSNTTQATEILSVGKSSSNGTAPTNPTYYAVSKNASVTCSYYDSDKLTDTQGLSYNGGGDALSTSELINGTTLDNFYYGDWNYENGRYPIPDLEGEISSDAWNLLVSTVSEQ